MSTADKIALAGAAFAFWAVFTGALVATCLTIGRWERGQAALRAALDPPRPHADVREIATGRPHLRVIINNAGDEVARKVFPPGDAA